MPLRHFSRILPDTDNRYDIAKRNKMYHVKITINFPRKIRNFFFLQRGIEEKKKCGILQTMVQIRVFGWAHVGAHADPHVLNTSFGPHSSPNEPSKTQSHHVIYLSQYIPLHLLLLIIFFTSKNSS